MKKLIFPCLLFVAAVGVRTCLAQALSDSEIQQKLLAQPPQSAVELRSIFRSKGKPGTLQVAFTRADLDGSGTFSYFVAYYSTETSNAGYLRVFKQSGDSLTVAGDVENGAEVGGFGAGIDLIDVNGDGIPEVIVTSTTAGGQEELFSLFMWTGSSLHDMLGDRVGTGSLDDIDNDGVLEIVDTRSDGKGYDIYKLSGSDYQFFKTVKEDPRGLVRTNGNINYVRAFCSTLEPQHFSLSAIHEALAGKHTEREHERRESVHLTVGGLRQLDGKLVTVDQVDTTTVVVNPHLIPLRVSVHPREEKLNRDADGDKDKDSEELCEKDHGRISVELARMDFLKALPKLQPTAPLAVGDQIKIRLTAKLKDGSPVSAIFKAKIVGEHNRDDREKEKDHKDKSGS